MFRLIRAFTFVACMVVLGGAPYTALAQGSPGIVRVKASILAIGTFQATRAPQFRYRGTGFVVGDGSLAATSAHVLPEELDTGSAPEILVALLPGDADVSRAEVRRLTRLAVESEHDLALLRMSGTPLQPLTVRDSGAVAEGDHLLLTGFPIGDVLGLYPATHRAMVSAIAPVAIPSATARQLDAKVLRQLRKPAFSIFQLDAVAYPGSSGSPLYDPVSGDVVGVVNMGFVRGTRESALSQPSGITYAIPSRFLIELLQRVKP
jgi:serine protease Do